MKRITALLLLLAIGFIRPAYPEDTEEEDTFTTLTRRPTPRASLPTNISVVTAKDIEESGAHSLPDVLDRLAGIDLSRSGSLGSLTTIRMRGANTADQIQVVIDDQPVGGVSVQNINIDLIPLEDIERIEIVRGGSSVLYGANTIGGVIHIFTKRHTSDQPTAEVGMELGSLNTQINRAKAGFRNGKVGGSLVLNNYTTDGYQQNADVRNRDNSGNLGYFFENGASLSVDAAYTDRDLGSPNGTPVPMDQWDGELEKTPNSAHQRVENKVDRERLKGMMPIGNSTLETSVYHSRETYKLRLTEGIVDPLATFDNRIAGADTHLNMDQGTTVGVAYERDERYSQGQDGHHIVNWGSYLQQELEWSKLVLIPAVRFDQHSTYGNQINPRLTAVYKAKENLNFSANAARAYRSPTLVDLYIVATDPFFPAFDFFGNPNLKPETAYTYDAGIWTRLFENLDASITGFYTNLSDRIDTIDTDGNGNVDTLTNFSKAETYGAELEAHCTTWKLRHSTNLTLQRANGTSTSSSEYVPLRLTPHYLFNYQLGLPLPGGLDLFNTVQAAGHQYEQDNSGGVRLPSYTLWHARLTRAIRQVNLSFAVQNILDKRYAESVTFGNGVPQPGRTYWAGLDIKIP